MEPVQKKTIDDIEVGAVTTFAKTFTEADICLFGGLSGDVLNPIHLNEEFAKTTMFKGRIVYGMLTASLICTTLSMLAAPGAVHLSQDLKFKKPVYPQDTITAKAEVTEKITEKRILIVKTTCVNQRDELVIDGTAVLKMI